MSISRRFFAFICRVTEHQWTQGEYVGKGQCHRTQVCSRCGRQESLPPIHHWGDPALISEASCDRVQHCCREHCQATQLAKAGTRLAPHLDSVMRQSAAGSIERCIEDAGHSWTKYTIEFHRCKVCQVEEPHVWSSPSCVGMGHEDWHGSRKVTFQDYEIICELCFATSRYTECN
jgi:hypothetical protein